MPSLRSPMGAGELSPEDFGKKTKEGVGDYGPPGEKWA